MESRLSDLLLDYPRAADALINIEVWLVIDDAIAESFLSLSGEGGGIRPLRALALRGIREGAPYVLQVRSSEWKVATVVESSNKISWIRMFNRLLFLLQCTGTLCGLFSCRVLSLS
jgi:hypothetical protein